MVYPLTDITQFIDTVSCLRLLSTIEDAGGADDPRVDVGHFRVDRDLEVFQKRVLVEVCFGHETFHFFTPLKRRFARRLIIIPQQCRWA